MLYEVITIDNDLEKAIHDKTNIDRILHHSQVVSIKGESYRLKEKSLWNKNKMWILYFHMTDFYAFYLHFYIAVFKHFLNGVDTSVTTKS